MNCPRCQGLLVLEWCFDMREEEAVEILRCVPCGGRFDPVIEQHQQYRPEPEFSKRRKARPPQGPKKQKAELCLTGMVD